MKTKSILLSFLALASFASCQSDTKAVDKVSPDTELKLISRNHLKQPIGDRHVSLTIMEDKIGNRYLIATHYQGVAITVMPPKQQ